MEPNLGKYGQEVEEIWAYSILLCYRRIKMLVDVKSIYATEELKCFKCQNI
jgi:hypothetical protein